MDNGIEATKSNLYQMEKSGGQREKRQARGKKKKNNT